METIKQISDTLRKKGSPYFESLDLDLFINEIEKKYSSSISSYKTLTQEGEIVQLECSFLTDKAIYDFTLKKKSIEFFVFFLKDVSIVNEEVTRNNNILQIHNGGTSALLYKAYSENDKILLGDYAKNIISEINKI